MEELQKSHVLKVEELSRRKLTEDQHKIMELRARIQELQNEVNCINDSRDFQDAEAVRSGPSHVPSLQGVGYWSGHTTRITGIRELQQLRNCRSSTIERTNRWRMMYTASWTKRLISQQSF